MDKSDIKISKGLYEYILSVSLREHDSLRGLREITAKDPSAIMQIPPEQGQTESPIHPPLIGQLA